MVMVTSTGPCLEAHMGRSQPSSLQLSISRGSQSGWLHTEMFIVVADSRRLEEQHFPHITWMPCPLPGLSGLDLGGSV